MSPALINHAHARTVFALSAVRRILAMEMSINWNSPTTRALLTLEYSLYADLLEWDHVRKGSE